MNFVKILNPKIAVSGDIGSISITAQKYFPELVDNVEMLNSEWRLLADLQDLQQIDLVDIDSFWAHIFLMKNNLEEYMFPNLKKLIEALLSLPHSSAAAERRFSLVTLLKTKLRNRMEIETLDSILHVKELLNDQFCYNWEPPASLFERKIKY